MKHEVSTQITKETLSASLKRKMEKKALSKITVTEIVEDCGFNRRTFYYHFEDIYALVEWMLEQEAVELLRRSSSCLTWDEGVLLLLGYIKSNDHICRCALDGLGRELLQKFFYNDAIGIVRNIVNELSEGVSVSDSYKRFIAQFYTRALAETALSWITGGMKESPQELVKLLDVTVRGNVKAALCRAQEQRI